MNYTINEASKIRVGDTLTLEDGTVHEAVIGISSKDCKNCSIHLENEVYKCPDWKIPCIKTIGFHFKQVMPKILDEPLTTE